MDLRLERTRRWRQPLNEAWLYPSLAILSVLYFLPDVTLHANPYDEGVIVYGALRVLRGELPYRDWWTMYPPGQFYLLAALFKLFGPSLLVERVSNILIRSSLVLLAWRITAPFVSRSTALLCWLVGTVWLGRFSPFGSSVLIALLLSMTSVLLLERHSIDPTSPLRLLLGGMAAGATAVFRHDVGFYASLAGLIVLTFSASTGTVTESGSWARVASRMQGILLYVLGVAIIVLPVALCLVIAVPLKEVIEDLIIFPAHVFPSVRALPYPRPPGLSLFLNGSLSLRSYLSYSLTALPYYVVPLVFVLSMLLLVGRPHVQDSLDRARRWTILHLTLLAGALFPQILVRADLPHLLVFSVPVLLLLPLGQGILKRPSGGASYLPAVAALVLLLPMLVEPVYVKARVILGPPTEALPRSGDWSTLPERRLGYAVADPDELAAVGYIVDHVGPGERIFVGLWTHRRVETNDVLFYFLADRDSATRYHELHPGVATTERVQGEIAKDLAARDVRYVVLWSGADAESTTAANREEGAALLDAYLTRNYRHSATFGAYSIFVRDLSQGSGAL
ncbi:MAG TPA: hypothetical protein VGV60_02780 [Candidatus Polarisedimenticolia bacterium]|nr:hypothetical protein [Candidatus Polarisedimenticolia bacterium]